jgi:hypothetical protein
MARTAQRPVIERTNPFNGNEQLLTETVFLLGNGKSREGFDLERLRPYGTIIGCNALYRDFTPDLLICIDTKMLLEVHRINYAENNFLMMPAGRSTKIVKALEWRIKHYNTSGCFAIKMISALMRPKVCYMLGMDGYPGNVYDSTTNYNTTTLQNFTGITSRYKEAIAEGVTEGCQTVYVNVNPKDAWDYTSDSYKHITYKQFETTVLV